MKCWTLSFCSEDSNTALPLMLIGADERQVHVRMLGGGLPYQQAKVIWSGYLGALSKPDEDTWILENWQLWAKELSETPPERLERHLHAAGNYAPDIQIRAVQVPSGVSYAAMSKALLPRLYGREYWLLAGEHAGRVADRAQGTLYPPSTIDFEGGGSYHFDWIVEKRGSKTATLMMLDAHESDEADRRAREIQRLCRLGENVALHVVTIGRRAQAAPSSDRNDEQNVVEQRLNIADPTLTDKLYSAFQGF